MNLRLDPVDPRIVARLVEQLARKILGDENLLGLAPCEWAVLRFLGSAGQRARTSSGVATYLGMGEVAADFAIAALTRLTLVSSDTDMRAAPTSSFHLTLAGLKILKHDPVDGLSRAIAEMGPRDCAQLARLVTCVQDAMVRAGPSRLRLA